MNEFGDKTMRSQDTKRPIAGPRQVHAGPDNRFERVGELCGTGDGGSGADQASNVSRRKAGFVHAGEANHLDGWDLCPPQLGLLAADSKTYRCDTLAPLARSCA